MDSSNAGRLQAVIFDVDGTLYDQTKLRRQMLLRLLVASLKSPIDGVRTLTALRAFRRAQEMVRLEKEGDAVDRQLSVAASNTGLPAKQLHRIVQRWMEEEPLAILPRCVCPGLREVLSRCRSLGLKLAVLSDYPARSKVAAMELEGYFDLIVEAGDSEVRRFKPDPRGLSVTLRRLGLSPSEAAYVGDRPDVDAMAASKIGMKCVILGRKKNMSPENIGFVRIHNYQQLISALGLSHDLPATSAVMGKPE